jgi:hypothetical protein
MTGEGWTCPGRGPVVFGKTLWNPGKKSDKLGNLKIRRSPDMSGLGGRHV